MKLCKVEDLISGDILSRAIMTTDFQILLAEETKLNQEYIEKLKELNISEIYIRDENYKDIEAVNILKKDIENNFRENIKNILEKHIYSKNDEELQALCETADRIISSILNEIEVVGKVYDIKERSPDIYSHSVNICAFATLLTLKLELSQETIHDIGVGCLLHDLGILYLADDHFNKNLYEMSKKEAAEYKKHPIYGYSVLQNKTWISSLSKNIILYHHERLDGSGYPLKTREVPMEAKIVGICDEFDGMICGIGNKKVKVYEAVEYLKIFKDVKFDSKIVDKFLEFTAVYPVGSRVLTNKGNTGIVIRQNKEFPDRPVLRIIKDKNGNNLKKPEEINLTKVNTVFIEKVLE